MRKSDIKMQIHLPVSPGHEHHSPGPGAAELLVQQWPIQPSGTASQLSSRSQCEQLSTFHLVREYS